jgi:hypothetical protein
MELVMMAKKTTEKGTEKKEFAWDTEKMIGEFGDNKKKTEVRICTLNGKTYVSAQTSVMSAKTGDWKRTKNNTMEMSLFKDLQEMVGKWEMAEAFGASEGVIEVAGAKTKRTTAKKENKSAEPKAVAPKSGGLKAKKQAEGAKAKASSKKKADK